MLRLFCWLFGHKARFDWPRIGWFCRACGKRLPLGLEGCRLRRDKLK